MQKKYSFHVTYCLNNKRQSTQIPARTATLSSDQARVYLEALHVVTQASSLTNIQVSRNAHPAANGSDNYKNAYGK